MQLIYMQLTSKDPAANQNGLALELVLHYSTLDFFHPSKIIHFDTNHFLCKNCYGYFSYVLDRIWPLLNSDIWSHSSSTLSHSLFLSFSLSLSHTHILIMSVLQNKFLDKRFGTSLIRRPFNSKMIPGGQGEGVHGVGLGTGVPA